MKENTLTVKIQKSVSEVFAFTTTPPNSSLWINSIISEKTNEWPVRKGTSYMLQNQKGEIYEVFVAAIKKNSMIEWVSSNRNYHCRYKFRRITNRTCKLEYYEWVDKGEIAEPFTQDTLGKLKSVLER